MPHAAMIAAERIEEAAHTVMSKAGILQVGTPEKIYKGPNNLVVAGFNGAPIQPIEEIEARLKRSGTHG